MASDLISMSYASDASTLASLTSGTSRTSTATLASSLSVTTGQGADATALSKGGQSMQALKELAASDPEKFKEAAQEIADKLTEAAGNSTDANATKMLSEMAGKFASAASSGSMDSLSRPEPPTGAGSVQGQAAAQYARQGTTNPMAQMDGIVSDALSGVGSTAA